MRLSIPLSPSPPPPPPPPPPFSLLVGPRIDIAPQDKILQAGENLTLNCTGVNNMDATQPLTIVWIFTALGRDNTQRFFTTSDSQVTKIELDDNITVISYFTINGVMSRDSGEYDCYILNRQDPEVQPVTANATVTVLCKNYIFIIAFSPNQC